MIKGGRKFDFAVFGEPGGNGRITVGYRGRLGATLTTRTEGGHAGSPWAHESAVDASLSLLERLKKYEQEHLVADDHFRSLSVCMTMIRGGTYHNVLPSQARLTLDVRVPVGMNCAQVESEIRSIVSRQKPREDSTRFKVEFEGGTEPYEADPTSPLLRAFRRDNPDVKTEARDGSEDRHRGHEHPRKSAGDSLRHIRPGGGQPLPHET